MGSGASICRSSRVGGNEYSFHKHHGKKARLPNSRAAKRHKTKKYRNGAVVRTTQPIINGVKFAIRLDRTNVRWAGNLEFGVTTASAEEISFLSNMMDCRRGTTILWSGSELFRNGKLIKTNLDYDLEDFTVGDSIAVEVTSGRFPKFFYNGKEVFRENSDTDNPRSVTAAQSNSEDRKFFGVVDICGRAKSVSICEFNQQEGQHRENIKKEIRKEQWIEPVADRFGDTGADICQKEAQDKNSKKKKKEEEDILKKMQRTVRLLDDNDPCLAAKLALRDLLKPILNKDIKKRQEYGDHLASVGMAERLASLNEALAKKTRTASDDNTETEKWKAIRAVREILWMYSHYSMKLCRRLGKTGIPKQMLNDLTKYSSQPHCQKHKYMLTSALAIFYNCSKATGNKELYVDLQAAETFNELRNCTDLAIRTTALIVQAFSVDENTRSGDEFQAGEDVIAACVKRLENALCGEALKRQNEDGLSLLDVVTGIRNLASNDGHKAMLLENGVAVQLVNLIKRQGRIELEQECALSAFLVLCRGAEQREMIRNMQNIMNVLKNTASEGEGDLPLQQAAKRLLIELQSETNDASENNQENSCEYKRMCRDFIRNSLQIEDEYFNPNLDKCFCNDCSSFRREPMVYTRGSPQMDYCVPTGWCRFALEVPPRARAKKVFDTWHVAFHGTKKTVVSPILDHGDLLMPGDVTMLGEGISENPSNFSEYDKPADFDTKQIFVSPSIRYAGHDQYADKCNVNIAGSEYTTAKFAFQVRIKPDAYKVGPQTIKEDLDRVDLYVSNQEIEWFTKKRGCIVLSGLLLKLC